MILGMGWLGLIDLHFSWYANAFLLLSYLNADKTRISAAFGLAAFLLALSFLGYEKIIVSELPSYAEITAYGWGYFLWIMSIGIFAIAQLFLAFSQDSESVNVSRLVLIQSVWISVAFGFFSYHYFFKEDSQYSIEAQRKVAFEEICKLSGEHVYRKVQKPKGVFFDPNGGLAIIKDKSGIAHVAGASLLSLSYGKNGRPDFYEVRNNSSALDSASATPYKRFVGDDWRGVETATLESEYSVITKPFDIPRKLGILAATISIVDLKHNETIADSTYALSRIDGKSCGGSSGSFNSHMFVSKVLLD